MKQIKPRHYEDFVIGTPSWLLYLIRPIGWLMTRLGKQVPISQYYGTSVRRVGKNKVEVTFDLPPRVKQQMIRAIEAGKSIRLFVL